MNQLTPRPQQTAETRLHPELLGALRCPRTGEPLTLEGGHLVATSAGTKWRYPLNKGIPVLLAEAAQRAKDVSPVVGHEMQHAYWEEQSGRRHPADPIIAGFAQPKLEFIFRHLDLPAKPRILDVGCGNGYFTYYLEQRGPTVGLDYAHTMLRQNPSTNLVQGSAVQLPFQDQSFDLVFCSNLLHHVASPVAVVMEMKRVSRSAVAIHEPNRNNPLMLALGLTKREERQSLRFTKTYVRSVAEQAGLHVRGCEAIGFVTPNRLPRPVANFAMRFNEPTPISAYIILAAQRAA